MFRLIIYIFASFIFTTSAIIRQLVLLIKNPSTYFNSPVSVKFPSIVYDKKYGRSCISKVKTTKGENDESCELDMHYMLSGEEHSKTIIMIHGFPEFWFSYRYQIEYFNKKYRVIALDLRGYNLTEKPKCVADYRVNHLANDIKGLMDKLEIKSAILVAHDWGGAVAWAFEEMFPEMVEKLVTLNIPEPSAFALTLKKSLKQFLCSWYIMFFQVPWIPEWSLTRFDMDGIKQAFCSRKMGMQKTRLTDEEILAFKANMACEGTVTAAVNYYRAIFRMLGKKKKASRSIVPNRYQLIFGDKDGALTTDCAFNTSKMIPSLKLHMLPGISHWVQQDDPVTVNKLIDEFLLLN